MGNLKVIQRKIKKAIETQFDQIELIRLRTQKINRQLEEEKWKPNQKELIIQLENNAGILRSIEQMKEVAKTNDDNLKHFEKMA